MLAALVVYAKAGLVGLGRPISDFYVAGRLVPAMLNGMAIAIGVVTALAFAGLAGALSQGWDGASLLVIGGAGALLVIALFIAPYLRKFGGYTIPDFLAERFGRTGIRPFAVLAVILCSFPALALVLAGLGALTMRIVDVDAATAIAIGAGMLLLCSLVAGMRSASLTQIAQFAVLLAVSLVALAIALSQQGSLIPMFSAEDLDKALAAIKIESFAAEDRVNRFALLFCLGAGVASLPHILMRGLVTPSIEGARGSFLWALPFAAALCLVAAPYVVVFGARPDASGDVGQTVSLGLIAMGALSALLAAGSGLLLAIASALSYDIYYKGVHLTASTDQRILVARAAVVLVAGLAAFAALKAPEMALALTGASFSLAASTLLPALLLGIWWKRATPEGALAGMVAGLAVCLYYMLAPRYFPFAFYETSSFLSDATQDAAARYAALSQNYYLAADEAARQGALIAWEDKARALANWGGVKNDFAGLFAAPVGFLVTIGVSLFTPAPSREVQSFVEDLRKPSIA